MTGTWETFIFKFKFGNSSKQLKFWTKFEPVCLFSVSVSSRLDICI